MVAFDFSTTGTEVVEALKRHISRKTIVITGASDGSLGSQVAVDLALGAPSRIVLLARSAAKVDPVIDKIKSIDDTIETIFVAVELDKQPSIEQAAAEINAKIDRLDILINCAGVMAVPYSVNEAGIETQMAINHVGHFLLTRYLMPKILAAAPGARIVNVSSDGYQISPVHFQDINFTKQGSYNPWTGYGQSKTANILFTQALARRLAKHQVSCTACHPGVIQDTALSNHLDFSKEMSSLESAALENSGKPFTVGKPKTLEQGASSILRAAIDPEVESGSMLFDCQVHEIWEYAKSDKNAEQLWMWSEEVTGLKFDFQ